MRRLQRGCFLRRYCCCCTTRGTWHWIQVPATFKSDFFHAKPTHKLTLQTDWFCSFIDAERLCDMPLQDCLPKLLTVLMSQTYFESTWLTTFSNHRLLKWLLNLSHGFEILDCGRLWLPNCDHTVILWTSVLHQKAVLLFRRYKYGKEATDSDDKVLNVMLDWRRWLT